MQFSVEESQYFILSHKKGEVVAAGPLPHMTEWPDSLSIDGAEYLPLGDGDTFFFWDEIHNAAGSTVGYTFLLPESPAFRSSLFIRESSNVALDGEEVTVLLEPCDEPIWECVQGFGSDVYYNKRDKKDCIIYMLNYSRNPLAFSPSDQA